MTPADLARSAAEDLAPLEELPPAVAALWWTRRGDWERAHAIVQADEEGRDAAWVHAHLHRLEGDPGNARYWYDRAGRPASTASLDAEWDGIAVALLNRPVSVTLMNSG